MKLVVNHHHPFNGLAGSVNHSSSNSLGRIRGPPGRAETNFRAHISILFSESERLACKNSSSLGHREKLRRMKHRGFDQGICQGQIMVNMGSGHPSH